MNHSLNSTLDHTLPNCWQCEHFAISWDVQRPYSCRLMGFKSKSLPSSEVFKADGQACQCFYPKNRAATEQHHQKSGVAKKPLSEQRILNPVGTRSWLV
ncbi:MAG: hypothetical protein WCJ99_01510 [Betaproteobacteria bacterium]|jgi:hypothetical protein